MVMGCFYLANPNSIWGCPPLKHTTFSSMPSVSSFSMPSRLSVGSQKALVVADIAPPKGLAGLGLRRVCLRKNLSIVSFAATPDDSKPSEAELETAENNVEQAGKESQEAWDKALASFKEQAIKLRSVSQEAYDANSKKAIVVLTETAERLKIQADQARQDMSQLAKELSKDGRQYLTTAAENSPEPVKDVVETFATAEDLDDVSKVRDFYIGIPYGAILSAGGFLSFMITGSTSALRFGVILGGVLLALSVLSLRAWRKGNATDTILKGQAAIVSILFLRDIRLAFQGLTFFRLVKTAISGIVAAFFLYRIFYDKPQAQPNVDGEVQT